MNLEAVLGAQSGKSRVLTGCKAARERVKFLRLCVISCKTSEGLDLLLILHTSLRGINFLIEPFWQG